MIKYALICECDAEFEGWFPDSASYDKQKKAGQVTCPMCDSNKELSNYCLALIRLHKDKFSRDLKEAI